MTKKKFMTRF